MPEKQFIAVVHYMQQLVAGSATIKDINPLPGASTPQYILSPRRLQSQQSDAVTNSQLQINVDMDELSATSDNVSIISIKSKEFDARERNLNKEANDNAFCDVCQYSQPPNTNTEKVTRIVCRCNAMFYLFGAWNLDPS
ncbi:hypothetical protein EWB00_009924, partial [Schistosoma japonicum]